MASLLLPSSSKGAIAAYPPRNAKEDPRNAGTFFLVIKWNSKVPRPANNKVAEVIAGVNDDLNNLKGQWAGQVVVDVMGEFIKTYNAIIDYLKYGRPSYNSNYVFIRHKAPYGKLTGKVCSNALNRILHTYGFQSNVKFHFYFVI